MFLSARIIYSGEFGFAFLLWNLFLAYLPYWFINRCIRHTQPWKQSLYALFSILFLPNAPYIVTDLFHLGQSKAVPEWFDLILIFCFALTGLYYFVISFHRLLQWLKQVPIINHYPQITKLLLLSACAYGIYLGRFLRFNSWDVVSHPFHLVKTIGVSLFHPTHFAETWAITLTFTLFLFLVYELSVSEKRLTND